MSPLGIAEGLGRQHLKRTSILTRQGKSNSLMWRGANRQGCPPRKTVAGPLRVEAHSTFREAKKLSTALRG